MIVIAHASKTLPKALKCLCLSSALALVLAAGAHANDGPVGGTRDDTALESKAASVQTAMNNDIGWQPGLAGSILSSRFAAQHRDVNEASHYMRESLKRDPDNRSLQQEAMRAHVVAGEMEEAAKIAQLIKTYSPEDPLVATVLMIDAYKRANYVEAKQYLAQPMNKGLFGIVRPVLQQWLLVAEGGLKAPVNLQSSIDKAGFFAPFLHYHSALINDTLGFADIAEQHYVKSSANAALTPYRVIEAYANFHARRGDFDKAKALFDTYAKENPQSNLMPDDRAWKEGIVPPPLVANATEGMAELFFATASILFGEELTTESFIYLRLALALRPDLPPAQLMLANLYEANGEYEEAIRIYDAIKPGTVFYKRALIRRAVNLEALGKVDEAISELEALSERFQTDETALITLGDIFREQGKYEDAVGAYGQAISRMQPVTSEDWPLFYARGIAYERAGMWNAAEQDFNEALKLEPNQPDVLNYLGYSWLVMGKRTDKAKDYIEQALSARPDDPHILDSMGWAYFLSGEYEEAVGFLERAAELMPQDATVNDHLGDAYWRVGRKTEAEFQWKRALTFKPSKEDAKRIRLKLANGLPDKKTTDTKAEAHNSHATIEVQ